MRPELKAIATLGLISLAGAGVIAVVKAEAKEKYPSPLYEVQSVLGKHMEVRRYAPRIVAQVEVQGEEKEALNEGFRILAGYLFGKNKGRQEVGAEKIAMTSPVTAQAARIPMTSPVTARDSGTDLEVRFYMPPSYTLATLPQPLDPRIKIIELPEERYAAIKFSGSWKPANFSRHADDLVRCLEKNSIKSQGAPVNAYYDPPFMPPLFRHNEVLIPL